jgi:hypothetical protein
MHGAPIKTNRFTLQNQVKRSGGRRALCVVEGPAYVGIGHEVDAVADDFANRTAYCCEVGAGVSPGAAKRYKRCCGCRRCGSAGAGRDVRCRGCPDGDGPVGEGAAGGLTSR